MKFSWASDIHLNFLSEHRRKEFYDTLISHPGSSFILITGDIGSGDKTLPYLKELALYLKDSTMPVYFVLGNHDYYGDLSVESMRAEINYFCKQNPKFVFLTYGEGVSLDHGFALVGVDGWADARNGNYANSPVVLNDSKYIEDISPYTGEYYIDEPWDRVKNKAKCKEMIRRNMEHLADQDAKLLESQIDNILSKDVKPHTIIVATHVPPVTSYYFEGKPCSDDYLPFFTCKVMNDLLKRKSDENPKIDFFSFSGHTHQGGKVVESRNFGCSIAESEYRYPKVHEVILPRLKIPVKYVSRDQFEDWFNNF